MSNSFYYFFSAIPQVLGGILALFGVFVIFKLQLFENQLLGMSRNMLDNCTLYPLHTDHVSSELIKSHLEDALNKKDVNELKQEVESIVGDHQGDRDAFIKHYNVMKSVKRNTIRWSIFTAIIIILSLALIPIGECVYRNHLLFGIIVTVMLTCICIVFYGLIKILRTCIA